MFKKTTFNKFLDSLKNIEHGSIQVTSPKGEVYNFTSKNQNGIAADIHIKDYGVITNIAAKGDIGFTEDYRDGMWDTNNLQSLLLFAMQNTKSLDSYMDGTNLFKILANVIYFFKSNTINGSKRNISAHYDLGNDFYKIWLDPSMTYSSAIFYDKSQSLQNAQYNKYDRILERLGDNPSDVLEVGCGWGGFAERAVKNNDHRIKGITLSEQQHSYATDRLKGFKDSTNIVLEDYRIQEGKFDNIVSIEMFEAVGEKFWPIYFAKLASLLKDKGKAVIQTITIDDKIFDSYRKSGDLIRSFIFPGGMLPSQERFKYEVEKAGLKITDKYLFGNDYALTLEKWLNTFDEKIEEIKPLGFDEKFIKIWRMYLASCIASFSTDRTDVMQVEVQHA